MFTAHLYYFIFYFILLFYAVSFYSAKHNNFTSLRVLLLEAEKSNKLLHHIALTFWVFLTFHLWLCSYVVLENLSACAVKHFKMQTDCPVATACLNKLQNIPKGFYGLNLIWELQWNSCSAKHWNSTWKHLTAVEEQDCLQNGWGLYKHHREDDESENETASTFP